MKQILKESALLRLTKFVCLRCAAETASQEAAQILADHPDAILMTTKTLQAHLKDQLLWAHEQLPALYVKYLDAKIEDHGKSESWIEKILRSPDEEINDEQREQVER